MGEIDDIKRSRFIIGLSASIILHLLLFLIFQYLVAFNFEKPKEFRGAITVTLQKVMPEEGMIKQTTIPKKTTKAPSVKVKKEKSLSIKKLVKPAAPKFEVKKEYKPSLSRPMIKPPSVSANKAPKQAKSYSEFSTSGVSKSIPKGEVKTVSKEKGTVPVISQSVEEKEKVEKPLPFKPGVKIEESPMAFNVGELERKNIETASNVKQQGKIGETASKTEISGNKPVTSNSLIEWEKGAQSRKVISMGPKPNLPDWLKREGLKLKVTLVFKVTPDGYVNDVRVYQSSGYSDVDAAIIESVRKILFEPVKSKRPDTAKITYIIEPR